MAHGQRVSAGCFLGAFHTLGSDWRGAGLCIKALAGDGRREAFIHSRCIATRRFWDSSGHLDRWPVFL